MTQVVVSYPPPSPCNNCWVINTGILERNIGYKYLLFAALVVTSYLTFSRYKWNNPVFNIIDRVLTPSWKECSTSSLNQISLSDMRAVMLGWIKVWQAVIAIIAEKPERARVHRAS